MSNGSSAGVLVEELLRTASMVYGWPDFRQEPHRAIPFDASTAEKFFDTFGPIRFVPSPDGLAVEMPAANAPERLYMNRPGHFFVLGGPQGISFSDEVDGRIQVVRFVTPMTDVQWRRAVMEPSRYP